MPDRLSVTIKSKFAIALLALALFALAMILGTSRGRPSIEVQAGGDHEATNACSALFQLARLGVVDDLTDFGLPTSGIPRILVEDFSVSNVTCLDEWTAESSQVVALFWTFSDAQGRAATFLLHASETGAFWEEHLRETLRAETEEPFRFANAEGAVVGVASRIEAASDVGRFLTDERASPVGYLTSRQASP